MNDAALQARSGYNVHHSWECSSPEGFALNSKWNEAEKYICNPLSGKVPLECLSAKTLSGRSFRYSQPNRITMSAPLVYSSTTSTSKPSSNTQHHHHHLTLQFPSSLPASSGSSSSYIYIYTYFFIIINHITLN